MASQSNGLTGQTAFDQNFTNELQAAVLKRSLASSTALVPANQVTTMVAQTLPSVTPTSTALVPTNQERALTTRPVVRCEIIANPTDARTAALPGQFSYFRFIKNESYPLKQELGKWVPDHANATPIQTAQLRFFEIVRTIIKNNNPVGLEVHFDQLTSSTEEIQAILENSASADVRDSVPNLIIITKQITSNVLATAKDSSQTTIGALALSKFLEETDFDQQIQEIEESTQAEPTPVASPAPAAKSNKTGGINLLKTLLWVGGLVALFLSRDAIASAGQNLLNGATPSINGVQNFVGHSRNIVPTLNNEFVNSSSTDFVLVGNSFTPSRIPTAFVSATEEEDFEQERIQTEPETVAAPVALRVQQPSTPVRNELSFDEDVISEELVLTQEDASVVEETNVLPQQGTDASAFEANVLNEQTVVVFEEQEETSWFGTAAKIVALPVVALGILLNRG